MVKEGAKGDWYFRISDLVKNPDGIDTPVMNFGVKSGGPS